MDTATLTGIVLAVIVVVMMAWGIGKVSKRLTSSPQSQAA